VALRPNKTRTNWNLAFFRPFFATNHRLLIGSELMNDVPDVAIIIDDEYVLLDWPIILPITVARRGCGQPYEVSIVASMRQCVG